MGIKRKILKKLRHILPTHVRHQVIGELKLFWIKVQSGKKKNHNSKNLESKTHTPQAGRVHCQCVAVFSSGVTTIFDGLEKCW